MVMMMTNCKSNRSFGCSSSVNFDRLVRFCKTRYAFNVLIKFYFVTCICYGYNVLG